MVSVPLLSIAPHDFPLQLFNTDKISSTDVLWTKVDGKLVRVQGITNCFGKSTYIQVAIKNEKLTGNISINEIAAVVIHELAHAVKNYFGWDKYGATAKFKDDYSKIVSDETKADQKANRATMKPCEKKINELLKRLIEEEEK